MITGETLRRLRMHKRLNKKEAARKVGVTPAAYARLEQEGWLQGQTLQTILKALDCTTADVEKVMALLN